MRAAFVQHDEALAALKITRRGFVKAAERAQKRHTLFNPRRGFYVIVPPQYLSWGAPPPRAAFRTVFPEFVTQIPGQAWAKSKETAERLGMGDLV